MNSQQQSNPSSGDSSPRDQEYRFVQKKFFCHICQKDFKKMVNTVESDEVECPQCSQTFCEEISSQNDVNAIRQQVTGQSQRQEAVQSSSQPENASQNTGQRPTIVVPNNESEDDLLLRLLMGDSILGRRNRQQAAEQNPPVNQSQRLSPQQRRVVRRIITDSDGNQTIIEEVYTNNSISRTTTHLSASNSDRQANQNNQSQVPQVQENQQQSQQAQQQAQPQREEPRIIIFNQIPTFQIHHGFPIYGLQSPLESNIFRSNFDQNFRSLFGDNLIEQILRLSEQDRGRSGTPPASQEAVKNLQEVEISDKYCKVDEKTGAKELPRCTICCEDLKDKATLMPCGHLFNKECICEWLKQHNQCPICRHELPTDDADYERMKVQRRNSQQPNTEQSNQHQI